MPKALWIAHVHVTDEERYAKYAALATGAIESHGGEFMSRAGRYEILEGQDRKRNVVARFPSLQAAHDCYYSEAYQEALGFAKGASERDLMILEET
ncbi:DUF1330 domain-containing protein [Algirhabdus cladophorae]|uniref:DUF1330 domain-containing protein n=1 Tax=Algirhabdus cladophorae TaxID=3377108 RepID=UPI003B849F70